MAPDSFSIQPFEAKRVRVESSRSFEEVLQNLQTLVGTTGSEDVLQRAPKGSREHYEEAVRSHLGKSDFMLFLGVDHGEWLSLFGIQRKAVRWIFGNPLIALTMLRQDITAGLFAPVELLLFENESGKGSTVIYDLPSSLMVIEPHPALRAAAEGLDHKMQALVSRATGVAMGETAGHRA